MSSLTPLTDELIKRNTATPMDVREFCREMEQQVRIQVERGDNFWKIADASAKEIIALRSDLELAKNQCGAAHQEIEHWKIEAELSNKTRVEWQNRIDSLESDLQAAHARLQEAGRRVAELERQGTPSVTVDELARLHDSLEGQKALVNRYRIALSVILEHVGGKS